MAEPQSHDGSHQPNKQSANRMHEPHRAKVERDPYRQAGQPKPERAIPNRTTKRDVR